MMVLQMNPAVLERSVKRIWKNRFWEFISLSHRLIDQPLPKFLRLMISVNQVIHHIMQCQPVHLVNILFYSLEKLHMELWISHLSQSVPIHDEWKLSDLKIFDSFENMGLEGDHVLVLAVRSASKCSQEGANDGRELIIVKFVNVVHHHVVDSPVEVFIWCLAWQI